MTEPVEDDGEYILFWYLLVTVVYAAVGGTVYYLFF